MFFALQEQAAFDCLRPADTIVAVSVPLLDDGRYLLPEVRVSASASPRTRNCNLVPPCCCPKEAPEADQRSPRSLDVSFGLLRPMGAFPANTPAARTPQLLLRFSSGTSQ